MYVLQAKDGSYLNNRNNLVKKQKDALVFKTETSAKNTVRSLNKSKSKSVQKVFKKCLKVSLLWK